MTEQHTWAGAHGITWRYTHPGYAWSGRLGVDGTGNRYSIPGHGETCTLTTPDGATYTGWTVEEARRLAGLTEGAPSRALAALASLRAAVLDMPAEEDEE